MMKPAECEPARQVIDDIRSISTIKVNILVNEAMIISDPEDTHRTIFDPDERPVKECSSGELRIRQKKTGSEEQWDTVLYF